MCCTHFLLQMLTLKLSEIQLLVLLRRDTTLPRFCFYSVLVHFSHQCPHFSSPDATPAVLSKSNSFQHDEWCILWWVGFTQESSNWSLLFFDISISPNNFTYSSTHTQHFYTTVISQVNAQFTSDLTTPEKCHICMFLILAVTFELSCWSKQNSFS